MNLETKFKKDLCTFSDKADTELEKISSGSYYLDNILGGGYPKGCIVEVWGNESTGKTTACLNLIKEAQIAFPDQSTVFVDTEHSLNDNYAFNGVGVNPEKFSKFQPETGEGALDIIEDAIRRGEYSVVVLDSIAGLVPQNELETGKKKPGEIASLLSSRLNVIKNLVAQTKTLLFCTNQMRVTALIPRAVYGPTGGNSLKFYATIRLELKLKEQIVASGENVGQVVRAHTKKNKVAMPKRTTDFYITYGSGISKMDEILDMGIELELIHKTTKGAWFSLANGDTIGQDRPKAIDYLNDHQEMVEKIKSEAF